MWPVLFRGLIRDYTPRMDNTTAMPPQARLNRLRWRTRRGTRELDALFGGWLDERFATADAAQQQAFDELLDAQDPDLWDWVMGHARPERQDWQVIIDDIRARHRL